MPKGSRIKIFVAHHKPWYVYEDDVYVPIQVGKKNAKVDLWIIWDDTWDNISEKNDSYAELTAQYWVWKNYDLNDVDYVWFCHYRRYMTYCYSPNLLNYLFIKNITINKLTLWKEGNALFEYNKEILQKNSKNLTQYIQSNPFDLYAPKREVYYEWRLRKFLYMKRSTFLDTFFWGDNDKKTSTRQEAKRIFFELYPNYKEIIHDIDEEYKEYIPMHRHIFIMKKNLFLDYAEWLFKYLFTLEKYINQHHLQTKWIFREWETRFMGILSEPLISYRKKYLEREKWIKSQSKSNLIFFS